MEWLFSAVDPSIEWDYAMTTLVLRFFGVFVVMLVMQVALQVSARAVAWIEQPAVEPKPERGAASAATQAPSVVEGTIAPEVLAAIGTALELESREPPRDLRPSATTAWALAGRVDQLHRR